MSPVKKSLIFNAIGVAFITSTFSGLFLAAYDLANQTVDVEQTDCLFPTPTQEPNP